jgi:pimeloyl-ACP methyl ester carboxylesterase
MASRFVTLRSYAGCDRFVRVFRLWSLVSRLWWFAPWLFELRRLAFTMPSMTSAPAAAVAGILLALAACARQPGVRAVDACDDVDRGVGRCVSLSVPENRARPGGRTIPLRVVVLPAAGPDRAPDPVVFLAGGPGEAATRMARFYAESPLRDRRDLVFADQRGTGGSNDLRCDFYGAGSTPSPRFEDFLPVAKVPGCRAALEAAADLTQYTTAASVADLDDLRRELGYETLNLIGGSYGTRLAMEYVRQHEARVRTVTLEGPVPPALKAPEGFGRAAARALDGLLDECLADEACARAYPEIKEEAAAVFDRLRQGPATADGVEMTRDHVGEAIRYMLYSPEQASRVPQVLHAAYGRDFGPLARFLRQWRRDGTFDALYLSITCAEDVPFVAADAAERDEPTFLGGYRVRQQRAACALWPRGEAPAWRGQPVHARTPALIVSGTLDPVTPAEHGDAIARTLPDSLHVRVPSGAHSYRGLVGADCLEDLKRRFIDAGRAAGLDTACVASIRRRGFAIE